MHAKKRRKRGRSSEREGSLGSFQQHLDSTFSLPVAWRHCSQFSGKKKGILVPLSSGSQRFHLVHFKRTNNKVCRRSLIPSKQKSFCLRSSSLGEIQGSTRTSDSWKCKASV
ncbi:hypothetical protein VNO77_02632 [Canavalia gladiata]|uniref:Uncharacterized protein n=1 Tax=Canavalia gladiata TaxID=3824 RepID=A0AAN9MYW9_CANGL